MGDIETKEERYSKAFRETYVIVNDLAEELYVKIPKSFINLIKNNMDKDYNITLAQIQEQGELPETKAILALIYRDFLCDNETRKKLIEQENLEIQKENEKYYDMFKNKQRNVSKEQKQTVNQLMVIEKEKWYMKLWNKIRKLFYK